MRCREAFEILSVSGQEMGSSPFHGLGYDEGVNSSGRTGSSQEPPSGAAMGFARLGYRADRLQHTMNRRIAGPAADGVSHDDYRDFDGTPNSRARARNARAL
jgi:hypothetical protein